MAYNYYQGEYYPKNPQKYEYGQDKRNPFHRSGLEFSAFKWCDLSSSVVRWSNERVVIPYRSPVDGRMHRYYMDLKITVRTPNDTLKTVLVEIKPIAQTKEPRRGSNPKTYAEAFKTYAVNRAKWAAAEAYAKERGWGFLLWTENELCEGYQNDKELKHRMREHHKKVKEERTALAKRKERAKQAAEGIKQRIREEINTSSAQQSASPRSDP